MSCYRHTLRRKAKGGKVASPAKDMGVTAAKRARREAPTIEGPAARPRLDRPGRRVIRKAGGGGIDGLTPSLRDITELGRGRGLAASAARQSAAVLRSASQSVALLRPPRAGVLADQRRCAAYREIAEQLAPPSRGRGRLPIVPGDMIPCPSTTSLAMPPQAPHQASAIAPRRKPRRA